jgi:hypothetical protein
MQPRLPWGDLVALQSLPAVVQLGQPPGDPDTDDGIRPRLEVGQRDNESLRARTDFGIQLSLSKHIGPECRDQSIVDEPLELHRRIRSDKLTPAEQASVRHAVDPVAVDSPRAVEVAFAIAPSRS